MKIVYRWDITQEFSNPNKSLLHSFALVLTELIIIFYKVFLAKISLIRLAEC